MSLLQGYTLQTSGNAVETLCKINGGLGNGGLKGPKGPPWGPLEAPGGPLGPWDPWAAHEMAPRGPLGPLGGLWTGAPWAPGPLGRPMDGRPVGSLGPLGPQIHCYGSRINSKPCQKIDFYNFWVQYR